MANLLEKANILITPTAYSDGKIHSAKPIQSLSAEKVVNGDFATDSDWTKGTGWTISGGSANFNGSGFRALRQNVGLITGKIYKVTFYLNITSGDVIFQLGGATNRFTSSTTHTFYGTATANVGFDSFISLYSSTSSIYSIDNVSVKEVIDADLNFERGSAATRVNAQGLVENVDTLGSEAVSNGDFSNGNTDWTLQNNWSILNGRASGSNTNGYIYQNIGYQPGKVYKFTFEVIEVLNGEIRAVLNGSPDSVSESITEAGFYTFFLSNESPNGNASIEASSFTGSVTNVSVKEVIDVTNIPRINYKDGVGSWLIEPQSTNLITYSEDFSSLSVKNNAVVTSNSIISPSGLLDADKITFDGTSDGRVETYFSTTIGQPYTISLYLKNKDLSDTTQVWIGFSAASQGQFVTITNEWQRYDITTNADGTTEYPRIQFSGSGSLYAWGFQTEQLSYATSYIPTNGSVQTRLAENAIRSGLGDLIDSTEGVFYAEVSTINNVGGKWIALSDGTSSERLSIAFQGNSIRVYIRNTAGLVWDYSITSSILNFNKIAVKFKSADYALWINGVEVQTSTNASVLANLNKLSFDTGTTAPFYGNAKSLAVYPILTDEELECLTTR